MLEKNKRAALESNARKMCVSTQINIPHFGEITLGGLVGAILTVPCLWVFIFIWYGGLGVLICS